MNNVSGSSESVDTDTLLILLNLDLLKLKIKCLEISQLSSVNSPHMQFSQLNAVHDFSH